MKILHVSGRTVTSKILSHGSEMGSSATYAIFMDKPLVALLHLVNCNKLFIFNLFDMTKMYEIHVHINLK